MPDEPTKHIPEVVVAPALVVAPPVTAGERTDLSMSPDTTAESDRQSAGQRQVSMTWETTQRHIALAVTAVSLSVATWLAVMGATESVQTAALVFVFGVANLVIGFYFGRTNHTRVGGGGVGRRD